MTPYEIWQLSKYGNILPEIETVECEAVATTSEIYYAYTLEDPEQ